MAIQPIKPNMIRDVMDRKQNKDLMKVLEELITEIQKLRMELSQSNQVTRSSVIPRKR